MRGNQADKVGKNRQAKGKDFPDTKLTPEIVKHIRASSKRQIDLAAECGIDQSTISLIKNRKMWQWV